MTVTSISQPPPMTSSFVFYWERSQDPWHADAFVGTPADGMFVRDNPRREGWMAIDGAENEVGWVPDGTECSVIHKYDFSTGPVGRTIAKLKVNDNA